MRRTISYSVCSDGVELQEGLADIDVHFIGRAFLLRGEEGFERLARAALVEVLLAAPDELRRRLALVALLGELLDLVRRRNRKLDRPPGEEIVLDGEEDPQFHERRFGRARFQKFAGALPVFL